MKHGLETNDRGVGMRARGDMIETERCPNCGLQQVHVTRYACGSIHSKMDNLHTISHACRRIVELQFLNENALDLVVDAIGVGYIETTVLEERLNALKARAKVLGVEVG